MTSAATAAPQDAAMPQMTLWGPGHGENPFPLYDRMREQAAASKVKTPAGQEVWVVTRYDAAVTVLKDPRLTVDRRRLGHQPPLLQRWVMRGLGMDGDVMIGVDPPEHYRLRNLVQKAFTPRAIDKLEGWIEQTANQLLDEMAKKDEADLIAEFALPLPLTVISEMIGVPEARRLEFAKLVNHLFNFAADGRNIVQMASSGLLLKRYLSSLVRLKRRSPDDRLLSELLTAEESGDKLTESELVGTLLLLLFAGHETTVNLIGNGTLALFDHPEQLALLKAQPELTAQAVEEMLRFAPPVEYGVPRHALEALMIEDVAIPKGDSVIALLSAAGRDGRAFENPNKFDITREKNRQITFGFGSHFCLGAPLARMEGVIAFRALFQRFPALSLAVPRQSIEWWNMVGLRGVKSLPVRLR